MSDDLAEKVDNMTIEHSQDQMATTINTSGGFMDGGGVPGSEPEPAPAAAPAPAPAAAPVAAPAATEDNRFMGEKERRRSSAVKTFVGDNLSLGSNSTVTKKMTKHGDKKVVFSDYVIKVNRRNKMQKRVLMISDQALYNLDPSNFKCKRRIPLTILGSVSMSKLSDNFFALHMPSEYDYLMVSGKKCEIVTHIMNVYKETAGKALKVTFSNSFDYRIDSDNVREIHFTKVEGGVSTQIYTKSSKK